MLQLHEVVCHIYTFQRWCTLTNFLQ